MGKETAEGSPPVSEGDGELTDDMGQDGREDGEGKAGVKMEGKGESYVLSLKVVLPGSSEPLTVMVSSTLLVARSMGSGERVWREGRCLERGGMRVVRHQ